MSKLTKEQGLRWKEQRLFSWADENGKYMRTISKASVTHNDEAAAAGLARQTVHRLRNGDTMYPKHETLARLARVHGYEFALVKTRDPNYDLELPRAREAYRDYQKYLRQQREGEGKREKKRVRSNRRHSAGVARRASGGESRRVH